MAEITSFFLWTKFIIRVDNICSQFSIGKISFLLFLFMLVFLLLWKWLLFLRCFVFAWSPARCLAQRGSCSWAVGLTGKAECLLTSLQVSYCCKQRLMVWENANYIPRLLTGASLEFAVRPQKVIAATRGYTWFAVNWDEGGRRGWEVLGNEENWVIWCRGV